MPSVGKYHVIETVEYQMEKAKKLKRVIKETVPVDVGMGKYADIVNVGPGRYNIHDRQFGKAQGVSISPDKKKDTRSSSVPKLPGVHTYNPLPQYPNF